jgi:hypothetical protein
MISVYCHESLYGPVEGLDNFYYVSVLNPSRLDIDDYASFNITAKNDLGYAFGIIEKL